MSVVWQQQTHGVPRRREKVDQGVARLLLIGVAIVTALMVAYLALVASTIHLSGEIWALHNEMSDIQRENSRLETEIARLSSIPVLQVRSVELGYVPAESIEYIGVGEP
ncbi:MAG: hypothetical protein ACP5HS_08145 [Anaerolineae bacterium]